MFEMTSFVFFDYIIYTFTLYDVKGSWCKLEGIIASGTTDRKVF